MSLPPGVSVAGSHRELFQASVNSSVYSRVAEIGACAVPPGVSGLPQASWVLALLPTVVSVGTPPMVSQGPGAATLRNGPLGEVQPSPCTQQPMTELDGVVPLRKSREGFAVK